MNVVLALIVFCSTLKFVRLLNQEFPMLPNYLYETLPYGYMTAGAAAVVFTPGYVAAMSGALLILAGALVWILRSEHRRGDRHKLQLKSGVLPFWVYEIQPFAYVIAGLLCWQLSHNQFVYPFALIFIVVGAQVFVMRSSQRKHQLPQAQRMSHL